MKRTQTAGFVVALTAFLTLVLAQSPDFSRENAPLLYLLLIVAVGALRGALGAAITTVLSLLALDWYFTPPFHHLAIENTHDLVTLVVFVAVAAITSVLVETIKRRSSEAEEAQLLASTNEVRAALLSAVSHDLRTPLASIKTAATTLIETEGLSAPQTHLLSAVDRSVDRLNAMVQNLLDSSRIRTGSIDVRSNDIAIEELLPPVLELLPEAADRVELQLPEGLFLRVDHVLAERVLANLLGNALAFSPGPTKVQLVAQNVNDAIEICVVDHGPGISSDDRQRVLQPFQRLTDSSDGRGVGLGLSVANGFVLAMNGSLEIETTPGGGATVVVRFPKALS